MTNKKLISLTAAAAVLAYALHRAVEYIGDKIVYASERIGKTDWGR